MVRLVSVSVMTDYSITCWWSIMIVVLVYLSTECHLISWFIHYARLFGTNGISSFKWIYQINWKIYSWNKVSSCHFVSGNWNIQGIEWMFFVCVHFFFLFSSSTLWHKWVCSIHWWINCSGCSSMAGYRIRLLRVFWWCFTKWQRWWYKKVKTWRCPFKRQLLGSHDWIGCSCFWSFC